MNAYCPLCETELDRATSICPACRWDPRAVQPEPEAEPELSIAERYRGTEFDPRVRPMAAASRSSGLPRGRLLVLAGLLAIGGLYGSMMVYMGYAGHHEPAGISMQRSR